MEETARRRGNRMPTAHAPKVFVINLARSAERRRVMERHLRERGIPFVFFDAVDGQALSAERMQTYSPDLAKTTHGRTLSVGEIGCALSHADLYDEIITREIPFSLILEDDVALAPEAWGVLSQLCNSDAGWELINLITDVDEVIGAAIGPDQTHYLTTFLDRPNRTGAYLISLEGARKLRHAAFPIRMPADGLTGAFDITDVAVFGVYPPIATLLPFKSTFQRGNYPPKKIVWERKVISRVDESIATLNPTLIPSRWWVAWHTLRGQVGKILRKFLKDWRR